MIVINLQTKTKETQRANHAKEVVETTPDMLTTHDGIVCIGGDGIFNEVLNGLMFRADYTPTFRVGLIPAGSTNTIAFSTMGTTDVITCAMNIIFGTNPNSFFSFLFFEFGLTMSQKGNRLSLDVCSISNGEKVVKYASSFIGYGFVADIMKYSG